jgi:hypothetical protein
MDMRAFWEELFVASVIMALIVTLLTGAGLIAKETGFLAAILAALFAVFCYCASAINTDVIKEYFPATFTKVTILSHRFNPEFHNIAFRK